MHLFLRQLGDFGAFFVPLFVALQSGSLVAFISMTESYSEAGRRAIARRAIFAASVTGVSFMVAGQAIFNFLGVTFADFQVAGGVLVLVLAIIDLLSLRRSTTSTPGLGTARGEEPPLSMGIAPLGVPLIVGPATLTTELLLVSTYGDKYTGIYGPLGGQAMVFLMVAAALLVNLALLLLGMWYSSFIVRKVGTPTMTVINKIVMILLAAIAVSFLRRGIVASIPVH